MRARYGDWSSADHTRPSRRHSLFWKQVCQYGTAIRDDISWMVGDGSSIYVIDDIWLSDLPLSRWPSFVSIDVPSDMTVKELISSDPLMWNGPLVTCLFGAELAHRILSIPLTPATSTDARLWRRSCLSRAPTRDILDIFRSQPLDSIDAAWIWKLPTLPRIQLFIWKLLWECLPTCSLLARRGVPIQSTCPLCGGGEESTAHAIFSCPRVRYIWRSVGYQYGPEAADSICPQFLTNLRKASHYHQTLWASTAYQIWLSRNQSIFTDDCTTIQRTLWKIRALMVDYGSAYGSIDYDSPGLWSSPAASAANRHTVFISWEPPPPGFVKINFDGSVRGRLAGSAFVIRGPEGDLKAAGGFGSLDSSVPMAELYAAWAGISYAVRSLKAQALIIEGDSMTIVRWLRRELDTLPTTNPILQDIWATLSELQEVQIRHIFREANAAADWAASTVALHSGSWSWRQGDLCPPILQQIIFSDISGLTRTRVV